MYFWRIDRLKARLIAQPLTDREVLPYLLIFMGLTTLVAVFPPPSMNVWDYAIGLGTVVLTFIGTVYAYRCNNGAQGQHFLQRYFALGWVIVVRLLAVTLPLTFVLFAILSTPDGTTWHMAVLTAVVGFVFYQRLGHHIRTVANGLRSNTTPHTDARDVPPSADATGARAGGREYKDFPGTASGLTRGRTASL